MLNRLDTLKAMGIEVWTVRGAEPNIEPAVQPVPVPLPQSNPQPKPSPAETSTPAADIPEFRLALLHYESFGICLSLATGADLPRRFCDDIARVMGGNTENVRFQLLEWPMLNTSGIDQSLNAARQVVTQKFAVMPGKVVVFGRDVSEYFSPLSEVESDQPSLVGRQNFLMVPSLAELMKSSSGKRNLMNVLYSWAQQQG